MHVSYHAAFQAAYPRLAAAGRTPADENSPPLTRDAPYPTPLNAIPSS